MPIFLPSNIENSDFERRLVEHGVPVARNHTANGNGPLRIGLLNLMPAPAMETTETQWLRWIGSQATLLIEPVLIKFDDDRRERPGASREDILSRYLPFSDVAMKGLHGLIVTGDNLEITKHSGFSSHPRELPFEDIHYYDQLYELVDWANQNVASTIYSCLASHFALSHLYGIARTVGDTKTVGVYRHAITNPNSPFMSVLQRYILAPHSRWGSSPTEELLAATNMLVLAQNPEVGWLAAERTNKKGGNDLLLQGHPEYDRLDLHKEYIRDRANGLMVPKNYYKNNEPLANNAQLTWANDARQLHQNWIMHVLEHAN